MAARQIGVAVVQIKADTAEFRRGLSGIGSSLSSAFSGMARKIGALGLGHLAREAIEFGATYRVQLDNARAAVDGLTSSQAEADTLLRKMTQFAIATPFDLPGVQEATTRLLAYGQGFGVTSANVLDYVQIIGDAAASTGKGSDAMLNVITVLGKISGQGRVTMRDMNQLTANFPSLHPWEILAELTGKTEQELRKLALKPGGLTGIASATDIINALTEGMEKMPGAAGAMERRMNTLGGTFEMFKDTMGVALADGLEPFFSALQSALRDQNVQNALTTLIKTFADLTSQVMAGLLPVLPSLINSFQNIVAALMPAAPAVGDLVMMFAMGLAALAPLIQVLSKLATVVTGFLMKLNPDYLGILSAALIVFWLSLSGGPLVAAIIATVAALAIFIIQNWDSIVAATKWLGDQMVDLWNTVLEILDPVINWVKEIIKWFKYLYNMLVGHSIIPDLVNGIINWFGILARAVVAIVQGIKTVIIAVWNAIKTAVTVVVQAIWTVIKFYFNAYKFIITTEINIIRIVVITVFNAIRSFLTTLWNGIRSFLSAVWAGIRNTASAVWNAIKTAIITPIQAARSAAASAVGSIASAVYGAWSGLSGFVSAVWNGIKNAITGPIQAAYSFVQRTVGAIASAVRGAINAVKSIPGAGIVSNVIGWLHAEGGVFQRPHVGIVAEAGPEAIVPLNNPMRAMAVMHQAGLDRLVGEMSRNRGFNGPLVSMPGAVIQDATDADLVAQRTLVAMQAAMVA